MAISRLFSYQDYIYASRGISCQPYKSITKRRLFGFIRIFTHFYLCQQIIGASSNVISTGDLRNIFPVFFNILCYLIYLFMSFKLDAIVNEITSFGDRFLTAEVKRNLIKIELYSLIAYIIWFIIYLSIGVTNQIIMTFYFNNETVNFDKLSYWTPTPNADDSPIFTMIYILLFMFLTFHLADAMIVSSVFVYSYLAFLIFKFKLVFLDYVIKKKTTIKEFRIIWNEIIDMRDDLEDNLNTIPFLSIAMLFFNTISIVVIFSKGDATDGALCRTISYWAFEIVLAIPILSMPFLVSWMQKKLRDHLKKIRKKITREYSSSESELASLMDDIKSNLDMNLTGYGMFKLNKEFVLAFISSVISFSVLFMQLTQN